MSENKKGQGFSLLELMVVIFLFTLMITLGVVNVRYLKKAVIKNEIDLLYSTCVSLQHMAMASNQIQELVFDENAQQYSYNGHIHSLSDALKIGIVPTAKGPPSSPHAPLKSAITFADNKISFYPDGIIASGAVYFKDKNDALYAMSSSVGHISYLRTYRYDGKWHLL